MTGPALSTKNEDTSTQSYEWTTSLPLHGADDNSLPFAKLPNDVSREQKALTRTPGTYNVILTPASFVGLPEYARSKRSSRTSSKDCSVDSAAMQGERSSDESDVIILSEFEDTPYVRLTPSSPSTSLGTNKVNVMFHIAYVPEIPRDFANYGTRDADNTKTIMLYQNSILKRIMPYGTRFKLNLGVNNEDVVVTLSKSFRPLYHAVCAITMLALALRGRSDLLTGAFRHYDQAISACLTYSDIDTDQFFYVHFLLLLYDMCCATQHWPQDTQMWAQHLKHLSRIIHKRKPGTMVNRLKAYTSWYILFLDIQSCFAGNEESGSYVQAYLDNGSSLPRWPLSPSPDKKDAIDGNAEFMATHSLVLHLFTMSAKQCQLAMAMRQGFRECSDTVEELSLRVETFCNTLRTQWTEKCPPSMRSDVPRISRKESPQIVRSTFEFAQLQYSVMAIYLHTSMFSKQRLYARCYQREDAYHCSSILSMASKAVANRDTSNHHMVPALFLAGFATTSHQEKSLAMQLLKAMEGTGISRSVTRTRELLQLVVEEQAKRVAVGGLAEEVDWIEFSQERGIKCINFGL